MVATDLSPRCDRAMERAILLAEQWNGQLIIAHVPPCKERLAEDAERQLRSFILEEFGFPEPGPKILFGCGSVPATVAELARNQNSSLIVTGMARFNSPSDYILGTTVDYLVRKSDAPILVVKRRARRAYERALITTDFSKCTVDALSTAASLFPAAKLRLMHSFHPAFEAFLSPGSTTPLIRRESEIAMQRLLNDLPPTLRRRVEPALDEGHLGSTVHEEIASWRADLLVLGSHGRGKLAHATMGDVASDLLTNAPCDVLVVKEHRTAFRPVKENSEQTEFPA